MKKEKLLQEITELKEVIEQNEIDIKDYLEMYELSREELKTVKGHNESLEREVKKLNARMDAMVDQKALYEDNQKYRKARQNIVMNHNSTLDALYRVESGYKRLMDEFMPFISKYKEDIVLLSDEFLIPIDREISPCLLERKSERIMAYDERHNEKTA